MDLIKKLLLLSSLLLALNAWSEEVPIQCNFDQKLGSNIIDKLNAIREKTLNTCLDCKGISCVMKIWPSNQKGDAMVCKRFFCTPMKIRKVVGHDEIPVGLTPGRNKILFTYNINTKGKVRDVEIKSVEGTMNRRDAYSWVTSVTGRTVFLPLVVNNETFEIINLSATMNAVVGSYDSP